jgi:hypothetical protein
VLSITPLGFPWATIDPFLFCATTTTPTRRATANSDLAPHLPAANWARTSAERTDGACTTATRYPDFRRIRIADSRPVTIVRQGLIDHADSLGAAARFGHGDVSG